MSTAAWTPPASLQVLRGQEREQRALAEKWLLKAAEDRSVAAAEWYRQGTAVLRAGTMWDAVRVQLPALGPDLGHEATSDVLRRRIHELDLHGPVVCDSARRPMVLYFFVPPGTDRDWYKAVAIPGVECLGGTAPYIHRLGVPRLDRQEPPTQYWVTPPDGTGQLVAPGRLRSLLRSRADEAQARAEAGR